MACILCIETSTKVCSVALAVDGEIVYSELSTEGPSHAVLLGVFAEKGLEEAKKRNLIPDAVAVSCGPGSYTGLRIGVSLAKGICFGYDIPIIGIPTLKIMTFWAISRQGNATGIYYPMLDARRMEVYSALYDQEGREIRETCAEIIEPRFLEKVPGVGTVFLFGNGAEKCKLLADSSRAVFLEDIFPVATEMVGLAEERFRHGLMEKAAYFEPFYLKEFQATIARNKVLGQV
ncbi:MAG: tRNA (adenosine(37)-N6)-threonylcarbamoyltransferase complex dimerization subunit type 1 TsaB [Massilibacteroides sp.]|nr:tRNA (adenosine(37)-N6)-threonylcarbamoyltransferase complex dimerization subunit type 1 TsaB [Massilibacteroides sp.]MDD3063393.1 tRNA (adenosine(37)-N6)-threonylcarbamoyltransferase complex dimerization subunit type 1 TsaB [Massilibacteroides sp.]MDD4115282.1 tRNA (adenosine(37)-N6)-threonylcarbamoyltransferase complex dimerization subunit type 1 TsaB [Massilibacteroides sp.]MDD4661152.1 tRNA (adenosine(37)-N6)-threonylcarbamoyltransferase complex dimerization subunit type 1 TsaB [Massiliba